MNLTNNNKKMLLVDSYCNNENLAIANRYVDGIYDNPVSIENGTI